MRAAIFKGPGSIEIGERPDPRIEQPTDAVVRVVMACVCGSDLWYYRGESEHAVGSIGHEFIGVVEDVGADVTTVAVGDLVVAPFIFSDMSCPHCRHGSTISCAPVATSATEPSTAAKARPSGSRSPAARSYRSPARVTPTPRCDRCLTLSDVMATGHHAACPPVSSTATRSRWSATAPSASPRCWRQSGSVPSGSSP